jgi:hypothetical protein
MKTLDIALKLSLVLFMVGNLFDMGLRLKLQEAIGALRNLRFVTLCLLWGFILVLPIVVIHCRSLNIGNFLSRRTLVVSLSVSHAGNWGKILILFRHTLHQLNDHRKQMIPRLNSHSGASDIANHDVDARSRRPEID